MRCAWSFLAVLAAQPAFADPFWDPPSAPVESYRLEVAAVDVAAVTALAIGHNSNVVIGLSVATYALGSPILHIAHGRIGTGIGCLFLRIGLPALGALVGATLTSGSGGGDPAIPGWLGGAGLGLAVGAIATSAIDIGKLAKGDDVPPRVVPAVAPTAQGGMTFGLAGRF